MLVRTAVLVVLLGLSAESAAASPEVLRDGVSGRMYAIRVAPPVRAALAAQGVPSAASLKAAADGFVSGNRELIGVANPDQDLVATAPETDARGLSRVKYFQRFNGLDVLGGEVTVHLNRDGQVVYVKTKVAGDLPTDTTPRFTEAAARSAAVQRALAETPDLGSAAVLTSRLLILPLGILRNEPAPTSSLAWEVEVADRATGGDEFGEAYYYDALNGTLLFQLSRMEGLTPITRQVYDSGGGSGGTIQLDVEDPLYPGYFHGRSEGMPSRGPFPNPNILPFFGSSDVDSMYSYLGLLDSYYSTTFGIDAPNGFGGTAVYPTVAANLTRGLVHNDHTGFSPTCPGAAIFSGTTGSITFCWGVVVPDVVGHEYSHTIVLHSFHDLNGKAIGPTYYGETGAMNEAWADFMGEIFEYVHTGTTDWRSKTSPNFAPNRDLRNPPSIPEFPFGPGGPDRHYSSSFSCDASDNGGVHYNSTVPSHAMYLFSEGGDFNGVTIQGQGKDAAQRVFFRGWRTYFSSTETLQEAYTDLIQACADLYAPSVTSELTKALQAGEMDQPGRCSGTPEVAPASAVNHSGHGATTLFDATPDTAFAVGQDVWLKFSGATPGRTLAFQLLPRDPSRPLWQATTSLALATGTGVVQPDGTLFTRFGAVPTAGSYDMLVDANNDGFYQPWADTVLPVTITPATSGVGPPAASWVTMLQSIRPNPSQQSAELEFSLAKPSQVTLAIFDVGGRRVRMLTSDMLPAGSHARAWDGRDDNGRSVGAGIYFVRLSAGAATFSRPLVRSR
jgi:hypothetical protein